MKDYTPDLLGVNDEPKEDLPGEPWIISGLGIAAILIPVIIVFIF